MRTREVQEGRTRNRKEFVTTLGAAGLALGVTVAGAEVTPAAAQEGEQMSFLDVPGARLYYETHGRGPLMVLVPGASGTVKFGGVFTTEMAAVYTMVTYDRRGFSRSHLTGPQDYARRLETDADDVRRLIEHLSDEPAMIFGSSSGGIVALEVLTRYPTVVRTLVPHEPPAVRLLPDGQEWVDFFFNVYDLYRQSGTEPAVKTFRERAFAESDLQAMGHDAGAQSDPILVNQTYWFERELRQYPPVELDLDALKARADRIVLVGGRESHGYPAYEVNVELGKQLGRELIELPGGHIGFVSQPAEFAREFLQALERTGHGPQA